MPNLRNGSKGGFEPGLTLLRVRHSTTELPCSIQHAKTEHHRTQLYLISRINRLRPGFNDTERSKVNGLTHISLVSLASDTTLLPLLTGHHLVNYDISP